MSVWERRRSKRDLTFVPIKRIVDMTIYIQQMSSLYVYVVFFIASYSARIEASRCMHRVFRMMMLKDDMTEQRWQECRTLVLLLFISDQRTNNSPPCRVLASRYSSSRSFLSGWSSLSSNVASNPAPNATSRGGRRINGSVNCENSGRRHDGSNGRSPPSLSNRPPPTRRHRQQARLPNHRPHQLI